MLGGVGHGGYQHHRIVSRDLRRLRHRRLSIAPVDIVDTKHICQKEAIELSAFQQLGEFDPGAEVGIAMHLISGMHPQPRRLVYHTVHVKGVKVDALVLHSVLVSVEYQPAGRAVPLSRYLPMMLSTC